MLTPIIFVTLGFSFGGLLASAFTAHLWHSSSISSTCLKQNLTCITFAQPHIPIPWFSLVAKECQDMVSTMHTVYWKEDVVPRLAMALNECCSSLGSKESQSSPQLDIKNPLGLVRSV